ncbi:MAG: type I-U CRISPR-associated protein Cas5/Cas6 [Gemmatimonadetes bacterium]|nr:type I-U CRISPR-associated protein Cas5/Cas6 [Gemmatimonadota bacterium]
MPRSLLIAVRFHEGRYHGVADGFDGAKGWPPSPARLFQALVASAARGSRLEADDQDALLWLERLPPPRVSAPAAHRGRDLKLFVPNNDLDSVGGDPALVGKIRVGKIWRPCFFDANVPILYSWEFESGEAMAGRVCSIAERLCQLGRGVDMAWAQGQVLDQERAQAALEAHSGALRIPGGAGQVPTPHRGTLDSLVERHARSRTRLRTERTGRKQVQTFTQPPPAYFGRTGYNTPVRRLHFELRSPKGGFSAQPLDSAFPFVASLRDAVAKRLMDSMPNDSARIEKLIVGRNASSADLARRIRILAIPSVGAEHVVPSIRRVLVEVPAECPLRLDDLKWAFAGVKAPGLEQGILVSTTESRMADRFCRSALAFETITPVALSSAQRRRIGETGQKSARERQQEERAAIGAVYQALRHVGIENRPTDVHVQREPFQKRGALAESFARGSRFSKHALWHVALRFGSPVLGPLFVGDGRFCGLGLMLPKESYDSLLAFDLGRRVAQRDWPRLVQGLRRALMSLDADDRGGVKRLFSGHEPDGSPDRSGHHSHVFLAADEVNADLDARTRLVVAAPWMVDRTAKRQPSDLAEFGNVVRKLHDLRAGSLGRFTGLIPHSVEDEDPLVGPTKTWVGQTLYVATRNMKRADDPQEFIKSDIVNECRRRGLPKPRDIELHRVKVGPRGGRPTAMVKLRFAVSVRGPILLGRTSHQGGGLFHAMTSPPTRNAG